jgi:hypothetical protein
MDIVTTLSVVECLGFIADGMEASSLIRLLEDGSRGILGGIHLQGVWTIRMGLLDDGVAQDKFFEPLNGSGAAWGPNKGRILLYELCQGFGNICETLDEGSLVAKNTEHATDLFYGGQLFWPGGQSIIFGQVDTNGTITDDDAQVVNRGLFEFALGGL